VIETQITLAYQHLNDTWGIAVNRAESANFRVDIVGVTGSIPVAPTISPAAEPGRLSRREPKNDALPLNHRPEWACQARTTIRAWLAVGMKQPPRGGGTVALPRRNVTLSVLFADGVADAAAREACLAAIAGAR